MADAGEILDHRFRLDTWLGAGGSGEVWRATTIDTGAQVVIKLGTARDETSRRLALREERISRVLQHNNIVRTLTGGVIPDGRAYLVYEFIEGLSLADILYEMAPFTPVHTVSFLRPLLDALRSMHAVGVLHRDIKPSNILISPERGPVLLDLGAAGLLSARGATKIGEVAGSPLYMSPEQINGTPQGPTADLYGLALVALEMNTGHPPPGGSSLLELFRERTMKTPDTSGASGELRPFLEACLKPRPKDRPASAEEAMGYLLPLTPEPWWEALESLKREAESRRRTEWIFAEVADPDSDQDFEEGSIAADWIFDDRVRGNFDEILADDAAGNLNASRYPSGRLVLRISVALNFFLLMLLSAVAFVAFSPSRQSTSRSAVTFHIDIATLGSISLSIAGLVICASGLWFVRLFHARSREARIELRYAATDAINDPGGADWLSRTIFVQIEEYNKIARTTGDRVLITTLWKLAQDMVGADSVTDQHNAMRMFFDLQDKLSARLTPWWLNYENLVGRALSALSLATGALAMFQGLRGLF